MSLLYDFAFIFVALFALGFTIFIHELGHFLAARQRGLVILRFSIGFGPKLFGWTRNGVEYRLSAIPFGGYVALPQLADMGRLEGQRELENDPYSENGEKNFKWKDMDNRKEERKTEKKTPNPNPPQNFLHRQDARFGNGGCFNMLLAFAPFLRSLFFWL